MPLTVLTWYGARRARKALYELVQFELTDRPTLLALVGDRFTQESHLRPFVPLAERFGDRLHVILCAEWDERDRLRDGELLFKTLGVAADVRPRLLRDEGDVRVGLLLRQRQPVALVDLYFAERAPPGIGPFRDDREPLFQAREEVVARELERLLARRAPDEGSVPRPPSGAVRPPAAQAPAAALTEPLPAGAHDFSPAGLCRSCGDGRLSLRACPGKPRDEGPRRDRFELIELD